MILLDNVVEIFDLTDLDTSFVLSVVTFERHRVGAALVDRNLIRRGIMPDCFAQKPQSGLAISSDGQQEVHGGAGLIDSPV